MGQKTHEKKVLAYVERARTAEFTEDQLAKAIDSLAKRDTLLADQVIAQDEKVDALELNIEEKAILTIARRSIRIDSERMLNDFIHTG